MIIQDIDECKKYEPCVRGTCVDRVANYLCMCEPEFGGKNCSVRLVGKECLTVLESLFDLALFVQDVRMNLAKTTVFAVLIWSTKLNISLTVPVLMVFTVIPVRILPQCRFLVIYTHQQNH